MTGTAGSVYLNHTVERDTNHLVVPRTSRSGSVMVGATRCEAGTLQSTLPRRIMLSDATLWDLPADDHRHRRRRERDRHGEDSARDHREEHPERRPHPLPRADGSPHRRGGEQLGCVCARGRACTCCAESKPPADLFDPDREREILEVMVREGPLVDGVTGKQTATVDGLTWEEYVKPLDPHSRDTGVVMAADLRNATGADVRGARAGRRAHRPDVRARPRVRAGEPRRAAARTGPSTFCSSASGTRSRARCST